MSGGDGFQDDDDVDVDGSYHDNDGEDDHNDDHDDDHDGELVKIEISGSGWRDPDEVVWPAAMHIGNTHMHSYYFEEGLLHVSRLRRRLHLGGKPKETQRWKRQNRCRL